MVEYLPNAARYEKGLKDDSVNTVTDVTSRFIPSLTSSTDVMRTLIQNSVMIAKDLQTDYLEETVKLANSYASIANSEHFKIQSIGPEDELRTESEKALIALDGKWISALDGGLGKGMMGSVVPFVARTVTFSVKLGDRSPDREQFDPAYYMANRLTGGALGAGEQLLEAVLLIFELQAALKTLRVKKPHMLIVHGPLVRSLNGFLAESYYLSPSDLRDVIGTELFNEFEKWFDTLGISTALKVDKRFYSFFCMTFLMRQIVESAEKNNSLVCGVVERSDATEITKQAMFADYDLFSQEHREWIRKVTGNDPASDGIDRIKLIDQFLGNLGYTDSLLLGSILKPGQYVTWKEVRANRRQYENKQRGLLIGFIHAYEELSDIVPHTVQTYMRTSVYNQPFKIEVPMSTNPEQRETIAKSIFAFSQFLPSYAFPVNLDVVDKLAKVPNWIMNAMMAMVTKEIYEGMGVREDMINYAQLLGGKARDWDLRPGVRRRLV